MEIEQLFHWTTFIVTLGIVCNHSILCVSTVSQGMAPSLDSLVCLCRTLYCIILARHRRGSAKGGPVWGSPQEWAGLVKWDGINILSHYVKIEIVYVLVRVTTLHSPRCSELPWLCGDEVTIHAEYHCQTYITCTKSRRTQWLDIHIRRLSMLYIMIIERCG